MAGMPCQALYLLLRFLRPGASDEAVSSKKCTDYYKILSGTIAPRNGLRFLGGGFNGLLDHRTRFGLIAPPIHLHPFSGFKILIMGEKMRDALNKHIG